MKKYKKIIVSVCLTLLLITCFSFNASALVFSDGDYGFEMNSVNKEMSLVEYTGTDTNVIIPASYGKYPVTRITKSALSGNNTVQAVNFPLSMKKIDDGALSFCYSLTTVNFPSYIINVGKEVCLNCKGLESALVNASIDRLPDYTFTGCSSLKNVTLSSSINIIGSFAFQNCTSLENADFISEITSIEKFAFESSGIKRLTIPNGVKSITEYSFANCNDLEFATIHKDVEFIDSTAFSNDPNLTLGVWYGSYGYDYAVENGMDYTLLDGVLLGDVNADDNVDVADVTKIQQFIAELADLDGIYLKTADVNNDGDVNIADATAVQMYVAEYDIPYPIGEPITK